MQLIDPNGRSDITVKGNVTAWDANTILLNGITVKRNVKLIGSEGTATVAERKNAIPWAIKDNTIGGNLIAADMTPLWIGLLHNHVCGNVILFHIHITDGLPPNNDPKPTIQVASNAIGRNLICYGLAPAVAGGSSLARSTSSAARRSASAQNCRTNDRRPTEGWESLI